MKRIISIALLLLLTLSLRGATNWLVWEKSPTPWITHYSINVGTNAPIFVPVPQTNYALVLPSGTTNVLVTIGAVKIYISSGFTNSVASDPIGILPFDIPLPPARPRIQSSIESASSPTGPWQSETNTMLVAEMMDARFYRLRGSISR